MEEILNKILDRLDSMDKRFDSVDARFDSVDARFDAVDENFVAVDEQFKSMATRLTNLENGQQPLQLEQSEMRKEVAFYYGSLMKKLDETKSELSSEIKHVSNIQKQHQDVLEILNEKQQ
ncbi:hypothetical protein [Mesobacillus selenatarsenatis]|uniref:Uncharacterized protein n=1 Tax=Mesobacillus selenatarsenatis TaxID=388741 RepID=A0A846TLD9_9BACI|nr:hypothetical protein [Mesobacillus selenatarsenatis]NKE07780.1 hypothetical protein [Mesobacillus selenatarsenatis]